MNGMNTQDRIDDICKISGLSEDIVRRVFDAERQSIVKSLRKGERATLIGRCVIRPEIRTKLNVGGTVSTYVKLSSSVASSLQSYMADLTDFNVETDEEDFKMPDGIFVTQIEALL